MEDEKQDKQLDSVTDVVHERETVDSGKAQEAMQALNSQIQQTEVVQVSSADVQVVMDEFDLTEDQATHVLQQVVPENDDTRLVAALRKLVRGEWNLGARALSFQERRLGWGAHSIALLNKTKMEILFSHGVVSPS